MKKSILVRAALSAVATVLTVAVSIAMAPSSVVLSGNAALGQMAHSDTSYVAAITGMNFVSMLGGNPNWILLVVLLLIWGSLLFKKTP